MKTISSTIRFCHVIVVAAFCLHALAPSLCAQNATDAKKEPPKIFGCAPLAIVPGAATKVVVRGWRLNDASAVRVEGEKIPSKITSQGAAALVDKYDPKRIGDQQLEFELTVPKEFSQHEVTFVVVTPAGESSPHTLCVGSDFPVVVEKEGNDGFRQAQPIALPQVVDGGIHANQNVDVFVFDGQANDKIVAEIFAARYGSVLDGTLSLYDDRGNVVAFADDEPDTIDPRLAVKLPASGKYYLVVQDAHDRGSNFHNYRLQIRRID